MAHRALAAAEKKLLPGSRVSTGSGVICGQIARVYPRCKRLQFRLGESKRRHPAWCSVLDQVSNLTFVAASQATAVDQRGSPIPGFSALAVATLTALRELFFGLAEIWRLTKSLDRCQSGRTSKSGKNRPLPHWSHHLS